MTTQKPPTLFRTITSLAAFCFLLWTLSSSTFLDASANFVEKKLDVVKEIRDRTSTQLHLAANHIMR